MPYFTLEWFGQLGRSLTDDWLIPTVLGLAALVGLTWLLIERHRPGLTATAPPLRQPGAASLPRPVLRGISGEFHGSLIELTEEPVLIGRDPKLCQLVFPAQMQGISKRHCIIRFHARSQCFLLVDCNSANGTFIVNGERLPNGGSELLNAGQRFFLSVPENMFEVNFEAPR